MEKLKRFLVASAIVGMFIAWLAGSPNKDNAAIAHNSAPRGGVSEIHIGNLRWSKEGFGTVMEASFSITNSNLYPVKDVEVRCLHFASSGTLIDSNSRTVYQRVPVGQTVLVHEMNMGFIHNQAQSSRCSVTGFSPA